jgi:Holliday junction resolvase
MGYAVGRRFEHAVKDKLREAGFDVRRVPLSGRQPGCRDLSDRTDIPNADLIVEDSFFGKAKTTKAKKYVSFPEGEVMELVNGQQDFLVFNFSRTPPFVVIRFEDFIDLLRMWREKKKNPPAASARAGPAKED